MIREVIKTEKEKDPNKDYHDWDEWVMESPATCAAPESWVRFCKRCGDKQQKNEGNRLEAKWVIKARSRLQDCFHEEVTWECELCHGKVNGVVVPDHQDKKEVREVEAHVYKIEESTMFLAKKKVSLLKSLPAQSPAMMSTTASTARITKLTK